MEINKKDNVVLVFEPATDAHWMKDVVQFPNALAIQLEQKKSLLITRPNHKQDTLKKHVDILFLGKEEKRNEQDFQKSNFSEIIYDTDWYLKACKVAASRGSILVLFPWYGDFAKGAKLFKEKGVKRINSKVILKTDGLLKSKSYRKATLKERWKDYFKFYYIDFVVCENIEDYKRMMINQRHLKSKLVYIPNCPLDLYHDQIPQAFSNRENKFLFVGRTDDPEKGLDILIDSWIKIAAKIPGWLLQIAGPSTDEIRSLWNEKLKSADLITTVKWLDSVNPDQLKELYNSAKIVVCSSRKESGPIILSEAILSGCAFIGTSVGEIPEILKDLPGLVTNVKNLDKQILYFVEHPEIAANQAHILYERMKERRWSKQVESIFKNGSVSV